MKTDSLTTTLRWHTLVRLTPALALMALTLPAQAYSPQPHTPQPQTTNLVQDGGFESALGGEHTAGTSTASLGDGWTMSQGTNFVFNGTVDPGFPYAGHQGLDLTSNYTETNTISQLLNTTPGQKYLLSFYAANDTPGSVFVAGFGDTTVPLTIPANGHGQPNYSFFSMDVTATDPLTTLSFTGNVPNGPNYGLQLDDVSVTPAGFPGTAPVPEASTTISFGILLALGLGGIIIAKRKKAGAVI